MSVQLITAALRKPRALRSGDVIQIVSPASGVAPEKLETAMKLLEAEGYRVRLAPHALDQDFYLAGADRDRADDLMAAFQDPEVAAVLCSRGGYGCARLLPFLDLDAMAASGKMFLGFSDITTLHLALNRRGLVTFHAPMMLTLSVDRPAWVYSSFLTVLKGGNPIPESAPAATTVIGGTAEGTVTGGCLILLTDSIGTQDALEMDGRIVLIEDVDENPHRVDAMLTHLINTGQAARAAGFVVGEMTRTDERADPTIGARPWREIVTDRLAPLGRPLVIDFPFGHAPAMLTLPLGIRARLDADRGTLTYMESACA
jgi:muramoyltetrapeptide carboxypeptidase